MAQANYGALSASELKSMEGLTYATTLRVRSRPTDLKPPVTKKPMTAEELQQWQQDREFEHSLQSGKMTDEELMQDLLKLCGWYNPNDEVLPPHSFVGSKTNGYQGASDDDDEDEGLPSFLTSKGSSKQQKTTQPASLFAHSRLNGLKQNCEDRLNKSFGKFGKKKSSLARNASVFLSSHETLPESAFTFSQDNNGFSNSSPTEFMFGAESNDSMDMLGGSSVVMQSSRFLEDAFSGIVLDDNASRSSALENDCSMDDETMDAISASDTASSSQNFWDDVEF